MSRLNVHTRFIADGGEGRDPHEPLRMLRHYLAAFPLARQRMYIALWLSALGLVICLLAYLLLGSLSGEYDRLMSSINACLVLSAISLHCFPSLAWRDAPALRARYRGLGLIERLAAGLFENDDAVEATPWEYRWIMGRARHDSAEIVLRL